MKEVVHFSEAEAQRYVGRTLHVKYGIKTEQGSVEVGTEATVMGQKSTGNQIFLEVQITCNGRYESKVTMRQDFDRKRFRKHFRVSETAGAP